MVNRSQDDDRVAALEQRVARLEQQVELLLGKMDFGESVYRNAGDPEIEQMLRQGSKIEAIKLYRQRTGLGLKEAKDAVEEIERRIR